MKGELFESILIVTDALITVIGAELLVEVE